MIEFLRLILHIMASLFKNEARGRNPNPSPTAQRASPTGIEATTTQQYRSLSVCLALSLVPFRPQRACNSPPRDDHPLASRGVPVVLARAVTQAGWQAETELCNLIGAMSRTSHLWGAPDIHGELLKLDFTIAQSTVARYMYRGWPPSQGWRTFLTNHVDGIAAVDLFVLPTITFRLPYCLVILRHGGRLWVSFGVTTNP